MKAYVIKQAGGSEALELIDIPEAKIENGQVRIAIKAFGLNRAEAVTRMGGSGKNVVFPKVIGIECVGEVIECPDETLEIGQKVAAAMGGMGRKYNGSYAEQVVMPLSNVFPVETNLDWTTFASLPETYFTAWGCCFESLKLSGRPKVLVRPGASALGLAITQIVNDMGGSVIGVTRSAHKVEKLKKAGMSHVIVSGEAVEEEVKAIWPEGADGIVDTIVSKMTLKDDLKIKAKKGRLCIAGSLADSYDGKGAGASAALALARPSVGFYSSETIHTNKQTAILQEVIHHVEAGRYQSIIDRVYDFEELQAAHVAMDRSAFAGKVVINVKSNW